MNYEERRAYVRWRLALQKGPVKFMLADILHKIAEDEQDLTRPFHPRPSLSGPERCARALVYYAMGEPRAPWPGRFIQVLDDSTWHAELIKDQIRKSAYKLHSEEMEVKTLVGPGHIDGIITDLLGDDRLLEIKAVNHFTFQRYQKGHWPLDYLTQTALYVEGLQRLNPAITQGLLFIKNKNNAAYMEVLVSYTSQTDTLQILNIISSDGDGTARSGLFVENITRMAGEKMRAIQHLAKIKKLPERPYAFGSDFPCSYCQWAKKCWDGYDTKGEAVDMQLRPEFESRAELYWELTKQIGDLVKEKDALREEMKLSLDKENITGGNTDHYDISLTFQEREVLKKNLPPELREKVVEISKSQVLRVRKIGGKNES